VIFNLECSKNREGQKGGERKRGKRKEGGTAEKRRGGNGKGREGKDKSARPQPEIVDPLLKQDSVLNIESTSTLA